MRRVEAIDAQDRAGRRHGGARRHEPDELCSSNGCAVGTRFFLDSRDDLVQRRRLEILDVHAHLRVTRARQEEAKRTHACKATALLADHRRDRAGGLDVRRGEIDVERNQRTTRSDNDAACTLVESRRTEVRLDLTGVDPPLQLLGATATVERRPAAGRRLCVQEDRQFQLGANPLREAQGRVTRPLTVGDVEGNDRDDVRRPDARMCSLVIPQVDALPCARNPREQRFDQRDVVTDHREHGPVVIDVRMDVEDVRMCGESAAERGDRLRISPFGKVRHGLEWQRHAAYSRKRSGWFTGKGSLDVGEKAPRANPVRPQCGAAESATWGSVKAYYDRRAPEYDDWWLGTGLYADRDRPGWDEERELLAAFIASLPEARTLDVACGTGFLTRHLPGEVVGLDASTRMLEVARRQAPNAQFVEGDALALPFEDRAFERVFTSYFYCHLEEPERRRFLSEVRRVARELVVAASVPGEGDELSRWEERRLADGSRWTVYKRVFTGEQLADELGGEVVFEGDWFVVVRA